MDKLHISDQTWDIFIAYYGNAINGTQRQAEVLYDKLNGVLLSNGHRLKVYQHTRCNPDGRFGSTPNIVADSKIFILLVDSNVPREKNGSLLKRNNETGLLKRLYEEVDAFRESKYYRSHYEEALCHAIVCDDMSNEDVEFLDRIFAGRPSRRWLHEIENDFSPLLKTAARFLSGSDEFFTEGEKQENEDASLQKKAITVSATRGDITIGGGAQGRLMRLPNGQCAPYECLSRVSDINTALEDNPFLTFSGFDSEPFVPDAEVFADCDKIAAYLESSQNLTEEESVFNRFIQDIQSGLKESRLVARISEIESIVPYGRMKIKIQPIEYLWIMRMTMLDTPFEDEGGMTTLRKKYANTIENNENFTVTSRLACHTGCGVFIITSDGYLVYQNRFEAQNNRVSFFPGKLSYTVSGSYLINSGSVFNFMDEKIDRELGILSHTLYLWELGYEYDYLHYQFSFFAFCDETKEQFIRCTSPRSAQAKGFSFYNLREETAIAADLQLERWESSAWAVLANALMSSQFNRLLKEKTGITFNRKRFIESFRSGH